MATKAELRAKIFASRKVRSKVVEFFDVEIELRQPTLGDIVSAQQNENREAAVIETLVKYSYIPGTDEKIFDESDADGFKSMPFGADFLRVSNALEELTEVSFLTKSADSSKTGASS